MLNNSECPYCGEHDITQIDFESYYCETCHKHFKGE